MSGQPTVFAAEFPPGTDSFEFDSLIPALRDTAAATLVTKITLLVWIAVAALIIFFLVAYRDPKIVPTRAQWMAESLYGAIRDGVCREVIGREGVRFAPYLTTLFCFILLTNLFGIIPFAQISPNSHIAFPAVLAVITYVVYIWLGIKKHGFFGYLKMSTIPPGTPILLLPIMIPIEFIQNLIMRPVTLAVRLFANMFAGHMVLLVFILGGVALFEAENFLLRPVSLLSWATAIAMTFFELVVQILQAYVFTLLTATYIQSSIAEEH